MNVIIHTDINHRHRADAQGVVQVRTQVIEVEGRWFEARWWADWATGVKQRIDSVEIGAARAAETIAQHQRMMAAKIVTANAVA